MPLPQREDYTIEDIYALPEGTRAELIDGQIYYMAPPTRKHQDIVGALYRKIADYIDSKRGSCKIYVSPFAVFLSENDKNYVEPDISVICDPNKLNDKGCTVPRTGSLKLSPPAAGEWIISPSYSNTGPQVFVNIGLWIHSRTLSLSTTSIPAIPNNTPLLTRSK